MGDTTPIDFAGPLPGTERKCPIKIEYPVSPRQ